MIAYSADTMEDIVKAANDNHINREDIVSLLRVGKSFILTYYV